VRPGTGRQPRDQGLLDAGQAVGAGRDQPDHQEQAERRPQAPGIARGEPGARQLEPQPADRRQQPGAVQGPECLGLGMAQAGRERLDQQGQRAMGKVAVELEPAARLGVAGRREAPQAAPQGQADGAGEGRQQQGMEPGWQAGRKVEQSENEEQAGDADRGPDRRPEPLPEEAEPRQQQPGPEPRPELPLDRLRCHRGRANLLGHCRRLLGIVGRARHSAGGWPLQEGSRPSP
jgi:hypothetical protein